MSIIISIFAVVVVTFILMFIIPKFVEIYEQNDIEISGITAAVIWVGTFLTNNIFIILGIILLAIIFVNTLVTTNEVQAGFWTSVGQNLINAVLQLFMWIADLVLKIMQYMMVGSWELEDYTGASKIQYSPGIILPFSSNLKLASKKGLFIYSIICCALLST
mgnify:CR=1 FL=1